MLYSVDETAIELEKRFESSTPFYFLRFGDGDLHLMSGHASEQRHRNSANLKRELKESFNIDDSNYLISSTCGAANDGSCAYWWFGNTSGEHARFDQNLINISNRFGLKKDHWHALVFQDKMMTDPDWVMSFFKKYLHDKKVFLLAGKPLYESELVWAALNVSEGISFPIANAYYKLEKKMPKIKEIMNDFDVIIPVIGMATRVLAKRLWNNGYRGYVLDVGVTVDALAEACHRGWTKNLVETGIIDKFKKEFL